MGASFLTESHKWCDVKELDRWFDNMAEDDRHENGTSYSGSWGMATGLSCLPEKVFTSEREAENWLSNNCCKWENALAVVVIKKGIDPASTKKIEAIKTKIKTIQTEKLFPLTGQKANSWGLTDPTWEREFDKAIIVRVKAAASKTKGCGKCGSSIATAYIRDVKCPICGTDHLTTDTDVKKKATLRAKITKIEAEVKALDDEAKSIHAKAEQAGKEESRSWMIGAVCSS